MAKNLACFCAIVLINNQLNMQKIKKAKIFLALAMFASLAFVALPHYVYAASCQSTSSTNQSAELQQCLKTNPIVKDIQTIVNFLSIGVGIVVVSMIIVGGIQYSIAGDNPQAVTAAKKRVTNALVALVAFIFSFAFVQWLIPGGIF